MDRVETSPHGDQRDRIMTVLREHANPKGYVTGDIEMIARLTGISSHDVVKHLWGLQKQRQVGFSTKRVHGRELPYRFRLLKGAPEPTSGISEATEPVPGISGPVTFIEAVVPVSQEALDDSMGIMDHRADPPRDTYPLITELLARDGKLAKVQEAARALEAAGLDDLALQTYEAIPALSPLEHEIVGLVARFGLESEWDKPGQTLRERITRGTKG
jgi:hypothetical protein